MDQVDRILFELKHNPNSRHMVTSLFNFEDLHEMHLYPCAWSVTFNVTGDQLNAILNQRSQDMLTANNWNVVQYALLLHMVAQATGFKAGTLLHVIADAHIYDRHIPLIKELIQNTPKQAPKLSIDPSITDFYAFTSDSFSLEGYTPSEFNHIIPVAV